MNNDLIGEEINFKWKELWKEFTGKDFVETKGDTISVEDGIERYAQLIAFWNWEGIEHLPKEFVNVRLHAAIRRAGELEQKIDSQFYLKSGILNKILQKSKDYTTPTS
jgi:hypothetical protein